MLYTYSPYHLITFIYIYIVFAPESMATGREWSDDTRCHEHQGHRRRNLQNYFPSGFQTQARHSLALPVDAGGDRHSNSARLVVTLSLPRPGARQRSGGPAPCWQAAAGLPPTVTDSDSDYRQPPDGRHSLLSGPGTHWQRLRVAVTHRDCGHGDFKPRPGTPSLALTVSTRLGLRQCRGQAPQRRPGPLRAGGCWPAAAHWLGLPSAARLLLSGPGTHWQRLRVAVTHRDCGHRDFKPRPGTPSLKVPKSTIVLVGTWITS